MRDAAVKLSSRSTAQYEFSTIRFAFSLPISLYWGGGGPVMLYPKPFHTLTAALVVNLLSGSAFKIPATRMDSCQFLTLGTLRNVRNVLPLIGHGGLEPTYITATAPQPRPQQHTLNSLSLCPHSLDVYLQLHTCPQIEHARKIRQSQSAY